MKNILNNNFLKIMFKTFLMVEIVFFVLYIINGFYYGILFPLEYHNAIWKILLKTSTFQRALTLSMPIIITAVGASFNERAGVINIGLEGIMVFGAFAAAYFTYTYNLNPWMGVIGAILFGFIASLIHAVATITFKGEQIVTGVAINLLALGLTKVFTFLIWGTQSSQGVEKLERFNLYEVPVLGRILEFLSFNTHYDKPVIGPFLEKLPDIVFAISNLNILIYICIILIPICNFILFHTTIGLRIRVIGEHPQAAETAGIPVYRYQYLAVLISGILASLGGAILVIGLTASTFIPEMVGGRGFIALAAMIFGKWTVFGAAGASLFFGFFFALNFQLGLIPGFEVPDDFLTMIPYIITMFALAGFIGDARPPENIGKAYDSEDTSLTEIFFFWFLPVVVLVGTIFSWHNLTYSGMVVTSFVTYQFLMLAILLGISIHFVMKIVRKQPNIDPQTHGAVFELGLFYFVLIGMIEVVILSNFGNLHPLLLILMHVVTVTLLGTATMPIVKRVVVDQFFIGLLDSMDFSNFITKIGISFFAILGLIHSVLVLVLFLVFNNFNMIFIVDVLILVIISAIIYFGIKYLYELFFKKLDL